MLIIEQMSSTDTFIRHQHTYDGNYGVHAVNVRAFNLANNDTVSANIDVLEWPCQSPNVTVDTALLDPDCPFSVEDKTGFMMNATFSVDCMKSERFTAQWELVDSNQVVLRTLANATQLINEPYAVPAGRYEVRITASLWSSYFDLSDKTVVISACVNVTMSDLVAGIEGDSFINATFNDTLQLSTYNLTYDLGIPSTSDKSRMILEWRCKRSNETWPTQLATQSYVPYNGTGSGCFGDVGPGVLGFAAGQWDLVIDTSYLEPLINYDIQFVVRKDVRSANADVTLFVQQSPAPVVQVRFVNYCYSEIVLVKRNFQLHKFSTNFIRFMGIKVAADYN